MATIKKLLILLMVCLLVGCGVDISGTWTDSEGLVEITFEDEKVVFFGVEGSYEIKGGRLEMTFETQILSYEYAFDDDQLILYLEEGELILERK